MTRTVGCANYLSHTPGKVLFFLWVLVSPLQNESNSLNSTNLWYGCKKSTSVNLSSSGNRKKHWTDVKPGCYSQFCYSSCLWVWEVTQVLWVFLPIVICHFCAVFVCVFASNLASTIHFHNHLDYRHRSSLLTQEFHSLSLSQISISWWQNFSERGGIDRTILPQWSWWSLQFYLAYTTPSLVAGTTGFLYPSLPLPFNASSSSFSLAST